MEHGANTVRHAVTVHHSDYEPTTTTRPTSHPSSQHRGSQVTNSHHPHHHHQDHHQAPQGLQHGSVVPPRYVPGIHRASQSFDDAHVPSYPQAHLPPHPQLHPHGHHHHHHVPPPLVVEGSQRSHHHHHGHHHHYPQTEPQQHRRRRHSSTSRLRTPSASGKNAHIAGNSSFIASITNNFMSFGAPFLFDWRLFCERGQPRYVHKHEGDGLRVDECEAKFLNKIAEEEKASLNAISDEDEHSASLRHGATRRNKSGTAAANVECLGSVRKSGFLSVKKWLLRKKNSLELARKRGWKGYWVCLKGTTLLFYRCDCDDQKSGGHVIEARPRHLIFVDACLVQAIPEHPKRDFVFCLSTAFGDAYLLDAPCLVERDHWIAAIHCACAAQLARSSGRTAVSHVLQKEIKQLEDAVDMETRTRAELEQMISSTLAAGSMSATEARNKQQQFLSQVQNTEEKIEKSRIEIFRLRSYLAALISEEDPNPKTLLSQTTKRSKVQLNRLGVFTVSSLHAFNCAKNATIIGNLTRSRSEDNLCGEHLITTYEHYAASRAAGLPVVGAGSGPGGKEIRVSVVIKMVNGQLHKFDFNATLSADQVLSKLLPAPIARDYYLRRVDDPTVVFKRHETILNHASTTLEVVPKIMFTCEMSRETNETLFGFSVESELCGYDLRVYVSRVEGNSLAAHQSLRRSDEIVVINGAFVQDLDMMYVESVLQEELTLCLTIRAARDESSRPNSRCNTANSLNIGWSSLGGSTTFPGDLGDGVPTTDDLIESLVCPPPPPIDASQMILSEKQLSKYIVPKVDNYLFSPSDGEEAKHCHKRDKMSFTSGVDGRAKSATTRSYSSKSARKNQAEVAPRPHSAGAFPRSHHGHHGHRHHHHTHRSGTSTVERSGASGHHHHHHHHHHHSSTKHIYHITEPQPALYGFLEQQILAGNTYDPSTAQQPAATQVQPDPNLMQPTTSAGGVEVPVHQDDQFAQLPTDQSTEQPIVEAAHPTTELTTVEVHSTSGGGGGLPETVATTTNVPLDAQPSTSMTEVATKSGFVSEITNEKLRKVVHELLDTEITYCQTLDQLMTLYLDPLLKSATLTNLDARRLVGSIPAVIITQNQFREDLTTIITNDELNIESIAKCFLNYCNDFKNYSTFCASHTKAIKLFADEKSVVHDLLTKLSKSSKHPNMYSLESYLIRPIQRILKYPLHLSQIKTLCPKDSQPYYKINEALRAIENVAEHINEMQRINEEYGSIFENLIASTKVNSKKSNPYMFDLTPISLIHYGGVDWINSVEFLGKSFRKSTSSSGGLNLHSMCFVFKQCVVFLCKETIRHGKSKKSSSAGAASDMEIIRHQVLIPVSEVQVRACPQTEHEPDFKWELIQLKTNAQGKRSEKIFRLSNSTNEYRNSFLRTIRQIIREDVRRMSIMSARPASTRSETSPTAKKSDKKPMVSFASTQNLTRCGYCGEDFTKMVKKGGG